MLLFIINIGKLNDKKIFNDGKYNIYSLGHSLKKIAEVTTISFVVILIMYLHLQYLDLNISKEYIYFSTHPLNIIVMVI